MFSLKTSKCCCPVPIPNQVLLVSMPLVLAAMIPSQGLQIFHLWSYRRSTHSHFLFWFFVHHGSLFLALTRSRSVALTNVMAQCSQDSFHFKSVTYSVIWSQQTHSGSQLTHFPCWLTGLKTRLRTILDLNKLSPY